MDLLTETEHVERAQRQIMQILGALESAIGRTVTSAELQSIDVTCVSDSVPKYMRQFVIFIPPPIGSDESA